MNIIVRIITGHIQDQDNNSYDHVVIVYAILAGISVVFGLILAAVSWYSVDLGHLQWPRKKRIANGALLNARKERFFGVNGKRNSIISMSCFGALVLLIMGSWAAYFYGVATGNNN